MAYPRSDHPPTENNTKEDKVRTGAIASVHKPDVEKYLPLLNDLDLNMSQKIKLIHELWTIMGAFVDTAFGLHPVQEVCGKEGQIRSIPPLLPPDALQLEISSDKDQHQAVAPQFEDAIGKGVRS